MASTVTSSRTFRNVRRSFARRVFRCSSRRRRAGRAPAGRGGRTPPTRCVAAAPSRRAPRTSCRPARPQQPAGGHRLGGGHRVKYAPNRRSRSAGSSRDSTDRNVFSLGRRNRIPSRESTSAGAVAAHVANPAYHASRPRSPGPRSPATRQRITPPTRIPWVRHRRQHIQELRVQHLDAVPGAPAVQRLRDRFHGRY